MKILHVITSLHIGGAERLVSEIVPLMRGRGHQVDVVLFDGESSSFRERLEKNGVRVISFSVGRSVYNLMNLFHLIPLMKQYDLVHTHNTAPQFFAALGSLFCSTFLVTTEHNTFNRRRNHKIFRWFDKFMYSRYKKIICISDMTKELLCAYLPEVKVKTLVVYNGINVAHYREPSSGPKSSLSEKKIICMIAGFRPQKDQDTLIRAYALLPDNKYELWLVGDGERKIELHNLVNKLKVNDGVKFLGIRSDVPQLLKQCDVVVMSSHWEGFGLAAVEGMAAGKPVVASNIPGLSQIVQGAGLLFSPGDAKELSDKILRITTDDNVYASVVDKCISRASEYDINIMVDGYLDVYTELFSSNKTFVL